jgi:hypothetical protein
MEQCLLTLESLDEDRRSSSQNNEAAKKRSKTTFDRHVNLRSFREGNLILAYDIAHDTFVQGNLNHFGMALTLSNIASPKAHTS